MQIGCPAKTRLAGALTALAAVSIAASAVALPAPTARSGVVQGKFTVRFATAPAAGSRVSCSIALVSDDTRAPTESAATDVPVKGKRAVCTVKVRYHWLLSKADSTIQLVYSVSGPSQNSSGVYDRITVPADGAHTTFSLVLDQ